MLRYDCFHHGMSSSQNWPRIAVVGAGAVGGYFGGMLARAGAPVVMIGRPAFVDAVRKNGLVLDAVQFKETVRVEASTELAAARGADVVLFCVKTTDTESTARSLAPLLPSSVAIASSSLASSSATVVSLQNGVDNAGKLRAARIDALSAVVYVAASVPEPGRVKHVGRGDLVVGPRNARSENFAALFARAGVACRISDNIDGELWTKLIWNCALNAISALGRAKYGLIAESEGARKVVEAVVNEVLAVASAAGIQLPGVETPQAGLAGALKIATQMAGAISSTGQDLMRGKRTEIDSLNGYISRRGAELGVPTPVNDALYALVKLAEESNELSARSAPAVTAR
jgi:2-dehydropantoate 2-reductase